MASNGIPGPLFQDLSQLNVKSNPKVCLGIQSAGRAASPINYLEQTVGALLARMSFPFDDVYIHVFDVDPGEQGHKGIAAVSDLVPVTKTKGELPPPDEIEVPMVPQFAESHDHREAMRVFDRIGCQYPILIEDDALPQEGWLDNVRKAIEQLEKRGTDWFVVKLYVAREPHNGRLDPTYVGITDYDQTFNGIALMYNAKHMLEYGDELVQHTRDVMSGRLDKKFYEFKDTYMNVYKIKKGVKIEAFEPPIFQHTGIYSSVNVRPLDEFPFGKESDEFSSQGKPIVFNPTLWQGLATHTALPIAIV